MRRQVQNLCYIIAAISFFGGLADVAIQFFEGQDIQWRIPLILLGFGSGLPIVIFPFHIPAPPKNDDSDYDDNDLSGVYKDSKSFLSSENDQESDNIDFNEDIETNS